MIKPNDRRIVRQPKTDLRFLRRHYDGPPAILVPEEFPVLCCVPSFEGLACFGSGVDEGSISGVEAEDVECEVELSHGGTVGAGGVDIGLTVGERACGGF